MKPSPSPASKQIQQHLEALSELYEGAFFNAKYSILAVPFHGTPVPVMVRELTQAQTLACGNFSLIETFMDKVAKKSAKFSQEDIIAYSERNHAIARAALVHPTYDEIIAILGGDSKLLEAKTLLDALKNRLRETPQGEEREQLEQKIDAMQIWVDLILPEDFLSFVVGYALGLDKSDIKLVSEEMLLNAAVLAEKGHDNPSDHIGGAFSDFMRSDIDLRAWVLLTEKRERDKQHGR